MRFLITISLVLVALFTASPANAQPYSLNPKIGASLDKERQCSGDLTVYTVYLRNDTRRGHRFRATEVRHGVKLSDDRWWVPRRTMSALIFYIPSGRRSAVTVTYHSEVLLHRRLIGICY